MEQGEEYLFFSSGFFGYGERGNFEQWSVWHILPLVVIAAAIFVTTCLTLPALFVPSVLTFTGPEYYRYYQYWMEHGMPVIAVFYMLFVRRKRPKYWHLWLSMGMLALLSIPCLIANHTIPGANYMYLGNFVEGSVGADDPLSFLPNSQALRYVILMGITIGLFHLLYAVEKVIEGRTEKKHVLPADE